MKELLEQTQDTVSQYLILNCNVVKVVGAFAGFQFYAFLRALFRKHRHSCLGSLILPGEIYKTHKFPPVHLLDMTSVSTLKEEWWKKIEYF